jgi:hypothetical protein
VRAAARLTGYVRVLVAMNVKYHVYVSNRGNVFMTEIAAMLAAGLSDLGYETVFPAPGLPEAARGRINLVVAPHEFYPLQRGVTERELIRAASASVAVGVEQPGTEWFELGTHYASVGAITLDISPYAVEELRGRGLNAHHIQLGYHRSWDRWGGDPARSRPTDVLFMGSMTARRNEILSDAAALLWDCTSDIRLFEFPRPMSEPRAGFVIGEAKWDVLASSRVLVNIHRNEVPYFEWVRVLESIINGCLVVTESSTDYGPLVPGEHLVAVPAELVGAYTASILIDESLRAEITTAAYDLVRTKLDFNALLESVCDHLESAGSGPALARPPVLYRRPDPPAPRASQPVLEAILEGERNARIRVKELLDSETELVQRIEALQARVRYGQADYADLSRTSSWAACEPEVTVVVTSYNYERFVTEAMESVMASLGLEVELVVVDDHSEDDSVASITALMERTDWFPTTLLARAANAGVSSARNAGIRQARAERVFMLDADNLVFPATLGKLSAALDRLPDAAFAYGIIARTGDPGLLSPFPWDIGRLCLSNYIDAMALIRREVLVEVGGYDSYSSLRGWEDYELWLRLAASGASATFVPEFVGSYRVHPTSRQHTVGLDTAALTREFRERYPFLPWDQG